MGAKLIAFECIATEHHDGAAMPDKLTIYRGAWAFCPHGVNAGGHDWQATGGEDLDVLMRRDGHSIMKSIESSGVSTDRAVPAKA